MRLGRGLLLELMVLAVVPAVAGAQDPVPLYPRNYRVLVENDRVRVLDFRLRKGDTEETHSHPAHVLYVLESFRIRFQLPGDRTVVREAKAGDVLFSEAVAHSPTNIGSTDAHGILIELKDPSAAQDVSQALTAVTFIRGRVGTEDQVKRELLSLSPATRDEPGNLGCGWVGFDFEKAFEKPVRIVNDAVMQALGAFEDGRMLFLGLGTGLFMPANTSAIMAGVPAHRRGVANGIRSTLQNTGTVVGTALSLALATSALPIGEKRAALETLYGLLTERKRPKATPKKNDTRRVSGASRAKQ